MDIKMPRMDGFEVQERLNGLDFSLPVIVMTGHGDVRTAVRAMRAGAVDFVEKPFDDAPLMTAIEGALAYPRHQRRESAAVHAVEWIATLSPRERDVLGGVLAGSPNKTIADDLGISVHTVEVHRARMMERLGAHSIAEAIRFGVLAGIQ